MAKYVEVEKVEEMLENAQIISDGVNCGYCTDDISLNTLAAEEVEEIPCHCQDCTKAGATAMFPGMLYCREFSTCVSQDEFCKRGQPEAKKDV